MNDDRMEWSEDDLRSVRLSPSEASKATEPQVAPEAISEERLLELAEIARRASYYQLPMVIDELLAARQKIAELEDDLKEKQVRVEMQVTAGRLDAERIASLEQQLAALKESHAELMRQRTRRETGSAQRRR